MLVSILIAFWIDAWWDGRKDRSLETEILELVAAEVEGNRAELQVVLADNEESLAGIDAFLRADPAALMDVQPDSVLSRVQSLPQIWTFNPNEEAASLLARTPVISPESLQLRALIARYLQVWADAAEEHQMLKEVQNDVMIGLAPYAGREADVGRAGLAGMVARGGPAVLGELRRDEDLVAAVIRKAAWQSIYLNESRRVLAALDSVSAAIAEAGSTRSP